MGSLSPRSGRMRAARPCLRRRRCRHQSTYIFIFISYILCIHIYHIGACLVWEVCWLRLAVCEELGGMRRRMCSAIYIYISIYIYIHKYIHTYIYIYIILFKHISYILYTHIYHIGGLPGMGSLSPRSRHMRGARPCLRRRRCRHQSTYIFMFTSYILCIHIYFIGGLPGMGSLLPGFGRTRAARRYLRRHRCLSIYMYIYIYIYI